MSKETSPKENKKINLKIYLKNKPEENFPTKKEELELAGKHIENENAISDQKLKKGICYWVMVIVSIYLLVIFSILGVVLFNGGELSDSVMIALLTTTTINILGLPLMIIMSLFPKDEKHKEK